MIVVTAILVFVMLVFAPLRFNVSAFAYLQDLSATLDVRIGVLKVFHEQVSLRGKYLHCEGTVTTDVEITSVDRKSSIDLMKCITIERLCVTLQNNVLNVSTFYVAIENALMALITATVCNVYHCQFYTRVVGTLNKSRIQLQTVASTSVAELSFSLLKQGVRQWKIRKLEK